MNALREMSVQEFLLSAEAREIRSFNDRLRDELRDSPVKCSRCLMIIDSRQISSHRCQCEGCEE